MFVTGTTCNKFLVQHKKVGLAQNILGPIKGQVITLCVGSLYFRASLDF